jgi:hypothetical protein
LIIRGCWIGRIVGPTAVTGADKTHWERPLETVTAEEESPIIGKPTAEEELATGETPAIEKGRAERAGMHKRNWVAEVTKPPHCSAPVKPANAASEPAESASVGWRQACHSPKAEGGCDNPYFVSEHHRNVLPLRHDDTVCVPIQVTLRAIEVFGPVTALSVVGQNWSLRI